MSTDIAQRLGHASLSTATDAELKLEYEHAEYMATWLDNTTYLGPNGLRQLSHWRARRLEAWAELKQRGIVS